MRPKRRIRLKLESAWGQLVSFFSFRDPEVHMFIIYIYTYMYIFLGSIWTNLIGKLFWLPAESEFLLSCWSLNRVIVAPEPLKTENQFEALPHSIQPSNCHCPLCPAHSRCPTVQLWHQTINFGNKRVLRRQQQQRQQQQPPITITIIKATDKCRRRHGQRLRQRQRRRQRLRMRT